MTQMNSTSRFSLIPRFLAVFLVSALAAVTAHAQIFHGGDFRKTPLGPDGTATNAHVGDIITTTITYLNLDDFNDTHNVTNLVDTVRHASGPV